MEKFKIKDILNYPEKLPESGWLYLPKEKNQWNLETEGIFSLDSAEFPADSDEYIPKEARDFEWIETVDKNIIEEIKFNLLSKTSNPTLDDFFRAFLFYIDNDAFI